LLADGFVRSPAATIPPGNVLAVANSTTTRLTLLDSDTCVDAISDDERTGDTYLARPY
jgi:hypothetical protein